MNAIKICKADKYLSLSELKPNPNNPRIISDDRLSQLMESIKRFGIYKPLRVHDNIVIGGNQTLRVLTELTAEGWTLDKVPVVELEGYTEDELKLILLNDNNGYGDWERESLSALMQELTDKALDISLAGFENPELYMQPVDYDQFDEIIDNIEEIKGDDKLASDEIEIIIKVSSEDWESTPALKTDIEGLKADYSFINMEIPTHA